MENNEISVKLWLTAFLLASLILIAVVIYAMHAGPVIAADNEAITAAASEVLECIRSGDFEALEHMLFGSPRLGSVPEKDGSTQSMIWYAFLDSIQFDISGPCYAVDSDLALDVTLTCLDISAVTDALQDLVPELLTQKELATKHNEEIYDEAHAYREEFMNVVIQEATAQVLSREIPVSEIPITLRLTRADGIWQVMPTQELLQFLAGAL